jgi:hypothetical protein
MFNLLGQMINLTWKVMSFTFVINIFWALMRSGKDTIKELRDTIIMAIKVGIQKVQKWLFTKYSENKES